MISVIIKHFKCIHQLFMLYGVLLLRYRLLGVEAPWLSTFFPFAAGLLLTLWVFLFSSTRTGESPAQIDFLSSPQNVLAAARTRAHLTSATQFSAGSAAATQFSRRMFSDGHGLNLVLLYHQKKSRPTTGCRGTTTNILFAPLGQRPLR